MKIINKIKAFFRKDEEDMEMDIVAAEIREGKAFLHPKDEPKATYLVRSDDIRIVMSEGRSLGRGDIIAVMPKTSAYGDEKTDGANKKSGNARKNTHQGEDAQDAPDLDRFKKKTFQVALYPEEYKQVTEILKESGYKRADFLLACIQTAKKASLEKAHKQIVKVHKQMRKEQRELIAKQLAELGQETQVV